MAIAAFWLLRSNPEPEGEWALDLEHAPPAPSVSEMPAEVRALVDRVASADPMDATKAWLEIGARYQTSKAFLSDLKPALWDTRPVAFAMSKEKFSGGGTTFVYFTVRTNSAQGPAVTASTVGQSLCYHLWQYEDVSHSGFEGSFRTWWKSYAPHHGLPSATFTP